MSTELGALQRWMQVVITHPKGVEPGVRSELARAAIDVAPDELESVVLPSREVSALDRVGVYGSMYFARLVEVLEDEYAGVRHVTGERGFANLVRHYVTVHPSRHWSLAALGQHFARFLREDAVELEHRGFLVDLARVERAIEEVFAERPATPMGVDDVLAIPPDRWGETRIETIPALRLLALDWPIDTFLLALREGVEPEVPAAAPTRLVVWRHDFRVWRKEVPAEAFAALGALADGATLGEALERVAELPGGDEAWFAGVGEWFREWTREGLFARPR